MLSCLLDPNRLHNTKLNLLDLPTLVHLDLAVVSTVVEESFNTLQPQHQILNCWTLFSIRQLPLQSPSEFWPPLVWAVLQSLQVLST